MNEGVWKGWFVCMEGCGKDGLCVWRGVKRMVCVYGGVWKGWFVCMEGCEKDGLCVWRVVERMVCVYGGV